ncbi:hypothetical protein DFJ74DRAFT_735922 [Hyaloraphidium curvatum]|nr:hypothetical protein DFJ74DRAFT_735922 [Hyaloraphidium curvatum]
MAIPRGLLVLLGLAAVLIAALMLAPASPLAETREARAETRPPAPAVPAAPLSCEPCRECPACPACPAPKCPPPPKCPACAACPVEGRKDGSRTSGEHPSGKPNLVVTSEANGFDRATISTFLFSLRDTGSRAEVLLLTTDPGDAELAVLAREFAPVHLVGWTLAEGREVVIERFAQYIAWMRREKAAVKYGRVFVSDLDVAFFRDPFAIPLPEPSGLALFAENRTLTIGMCEAHRNWMADCDGRLGDLWELMATESRICAGTVLGTADAVHALLDRMVGTLNASHCNDQLVLQHLHYSRKLPRAFVYPTETGPGATVGTELFWAMDRWGRPLNMLGEVVSFVHQFRYHEGIAEAVARRWPYLPRGDVREDAAVPVPGVRASNASAENAQRVAMARTGGPEVYRTCNWAKVQDCRGGVPNRDGSHDPKPEVVKGWKEEGKEYPRPKVPEWDGVPVKGLPKGYNWENRTANATVNRIAALRVALAAVPATVVVVNNDNWHVKAAANDDRTQKDAADGAGGAAEDSAEGAEDAEESASKDEGKGAEEEGDQAGGEEPGESGDSDAAEEGPADAISVDAGGERDAADAER